MERVSKDLLRWQKGLFSWMGRNNIIKMSVLPKFLFLLQAIPVKLPNLLIKKIQSLLVRFLWAG